MVSGFFTSPYDHARIFSGDASPILIASNSSSCVTCLNRSSNAFIETSGFGEGGTANGEAKKSGLRIASPHPSVHASTVLPTFAIRFCRFTLFTRSITVVVEIDVDRVGLDLPHEDA